MHVLATAGHVDHGKSTLVRALTGMEPDRWAEERRRGLTIDLGYAWTTLPDGTELAFVDVPGHERFIGNMLAGLGPAPAVLFVVAADDGWSRQSEEHLTAVNALDLRHGLLAVTRSDLADPTRAREESLDRIRQSSLGEVEAVTVSGTTEAGLDELRGAITRLVHRLPAPDPHAPIRLWIDRAFTVRGSGTVVTGTLAAGTIAPGDELVLRDRPVIVRSVQSLGTARDRISATARVALNLRNVARSDVERGDVLLTARAWHETRVIDVRLDVGSDLPAGLVLYVGTAAVPVRVRPLGEDTARLTFARGLPIRAGDRAVLHDPSRHGVTGGVLVLDADPPALSRRGAARRRAAELAKATGRPDAAAEIARRGAVRADHLAALGIVAAHPRAVHGWLISPLQWAQWVEQAPRAAAEWAQRNPLEPGIPLAALARALALPDDALLTAVLAETELAVAGGRIVATRDEHITGLAELERRLSDRPFAAPDRNDLADLGLGRRELAAAERAGRLIRIAEDVVLLPDAADRAIKALSALPQPFTASQARVALDSTRRVVVPLLEYLDRLGRTERVDDRTRRLRGV